MALELTIETNTRRRCNTLRSRLRTRQLHTPSYARMSPRSRGIARGVTVARRLIVPDACTRVLVASNARLEDATSTSIRSRRRASTSSSVFTRGFAFGAQRDDEKDAHAMPTIAQDVSVDAESMSRASGVTSSSHTGEAGEAWSVVASAVEPRDVAFGLDPVGVVADAMTCAHALTGAPWWLTLAASAVVVRAAMAPVSVQTIRASATLSAASSLAKASKGGDAERVGVRDVLDAVKDIRAKSPGIGAHLAWLVAGPLAQIPFFVCAVMAVRRLASDGAMNGLNAGGTAWFSDLTLPAVDVGTMIAPMGTYGGVLPVLTAAALFANVNANFAQAAQKSRGMTIVKLFLEWLTLPALVIGLQLPQAVHCYWFASSTYALAQNQLLSSTFARRTLGAEDLAKTTRALAASKGYSGEDAPIMTGATLDLVKAAAKARSENNNTLAINLLLRAARGESQDGSSSSTESDNKPLRGEDLGNSHPSVLFALGQTYALLKEWKKSALTYEYSARAEPNAMQRSRALMGAGVARARIGDLNLASEALGEANRLNPSDASIKVALASAVKLNGDPERALDILREAAALVPDIRERYVKPLERELGVDKAAAK